MTTPDLPWGFTKAHPGSYHRQSTWRERALEFHRPLPLWLRIAFMAYATHRTNGHATFAEGSLLKEFNAAAEAANKRPPGKRQLYRALTDAIEYGYLDRRSSLRCLIVPATSVCGGLGRVEDPCAYCDGRRTGRR